MFSHLRNSNSKIVSQFFYKTSIKISTFWMVVIIFELLITE
jgi:hypothetical protein